MITLLPPVCLALAWAPPGIAQVRLDRADPTITQQALPVPAPTEATAPVTDPTATVSVTEAPIETAEISRVVNAILIDGNREIPSSLFAPVLVRYIGRDLPRTELTKLTGEVASAARDAGYPFASASIRPQTLSDGILHVTLDEGQLAAVRVVGAINPLADTILTRALVTGRAVRGTSLERAILLVGDIPGLSVKESKYVLQDGFGILLVTVTEDRASAYGQIDNRGSAEVGPIRSTLLASLRGVAQSGDEFGLVGALTPLQPSEFAFLRARYSAPIDAQGGTVTIAGAYGRANPGASLAPLDVVGNSIDITVTYLRPLVRSRERSVWGTIEFRGLKSDQTLLGSDLRDDRLTVLTGALNGSTKAWGGVVRGEVAVVAGLPIDGVSREGDPLTSRSDGDARFLAWNYSVDWTAALGGPFTMVLATQGQLASRPLLAAMEIGAGGPGFGRAYDFAERTGDQGVLGSAEIRANLGRLSAIVTRFQLYGFVDGGYVDNLRSGLGGGALLSTGTGARLGYGPLDGMVEIAFPLNADRFDTGTKRPRLSFRLSRSF